MRAKLWPTGLISRVGLVLFAAVVLELVGSTFFFEQAEVVSSFDAQARRIAEQLDAAARVLTAVDPSRRSDLATSMSEPTLSLAWQATGYEPALLASDAPTRKLRNKLLSYEPSLAEHHLSVQPDPPEDDDTSAKGSLQLADGSTILFRTTELGNSTTSLYGQLGSIVVLSCCVLLAALLVVRTLAAPLRMLVSATDAIGHGPPIQLDDAQGPGEIRRVAQAFNAMQGRITKLVKDRTEALAAVSHDLRTPIARMKLRADLLKSKDDTIAFTDDLTEMETMLNDLLAYLGGETDPEKPKRTDIATLLHTLVDAANDTGKIASYQGPDHVTLNVRSLALKRAFSNIINNAIAYGDCAHAGVSETTQHVSIAIEDDGPGIPEAELASVFEPFYRVDASRNRQTGGMGLGLAIARQAVWREGGTIALQNNHPRGLRVTIVLPKT